MRVGDVLRLELRLEGDHISALTNGIPMLDFRHDKLKASGEWGTLVRTVIITHLTAPAPTRTAAANQRLGSMPGPAMPSAAPGSQLPR